MTQSKDAQIFAKKFLEDLLAFFGLNIDVGTEIDEDTVQLDVPSTHLNGFLIGQRGDNLKSIQYLINVALNNQGFDDVRVNIDVADYKKNKAERLERQVEKWIEQVVSTGEAYEARPMSAYDRRVVHKTVSEAEGVISESEGQGRDRHVVIKKAESA